jgi:hypothetical protein
MFGLKDVVIFLQTFYFAVKIFDFSFLIFQNMFNLSAQCFQSFIGPFASNFISSSSPDNSVVFVS